MSECNHGITFDYEEAKKIWGDWKPKTDLEYILGNPAAKKIRERWPRLYGACPLGCGYVGIYYASSEHYYMGDW